jgi:hypothetical protein
VPLGDGAIWDGGNIHARTGEISFSISVMKPAADDAAGRAVAETLARQVLAGLAQATNAVDLMHDEPGTDGTDGRIDVDIFVDR